MLSGPRGFDGGVQGQQIGLLGDRIDRADDRGNGFDFFAQLIDPFGTALERLIGCLSQF